MEEETYWEREERRAAEKAHEREEQREDSAQRKADRALLPASPEGTGFGKLPSGKMLQAAELREQGRSYQEIATLCGYASWDSARQVIRSYYRQFGVDRTPADVRAEAEAQLDEATALTARIMYAYEQENPELSLKAVGQLVRLSERRAKLNNADKATQVNVQEYAKRVALQRGHTIEEAEEIGLLAQSHAETMLREQGLPENDA